MLKEYDVVNEQSTDLKAQTVAVLEVGLGNVDKDLRAYLLTQGPAYLERVEGNIQKNLPTVYARCEDLFARQKTIFPQSGPHIDSFFVQLQVTKRSIQEYHGFCREMIALAGQDSTIQQIRTLMAQDRGMIPWQQWKVLNGVVKAYEDSLVQQVQAEYEWSIALLNGMLVLLLATGLPTLTWLLFRINRDQDKRDSLLNALKANNRKYLYDPGVTHHTETESEIIETSIAHLQQAAGFVRQITQGNYNTQWAGTTEFDQERNQSTLAGELVSMREKLIRIKLEDQQRNWINEGLNLIGSVLQRSDDLGKLSDQLLSTLVKYLPANQAAFFVVQQQDTAQPWMEMVGAYAYNRKKYLNKKIYPGQGLAGQAWQEAHTVYLKQVPEDYVHITSGLGEAPPRTVLIVPLIHDNRVIGVLELATFQPLEDHQREFIEKAAQNIASVLISIKNNETTKSLLEQTRQQAEQMQASEEEMRQNLEELEATQEEMRRQSSRNESLRQELEARERAFNATSIITESDLHGNIIKLNDRLCEVSQYTREELMGKPHNVLRHPDMPKQLFKLFWHTIKQGNTFRGIIKNRAKDGSHYWVDAVVSPVLEESGNVSKYVSVRYLISDDALGEALYQKMLREIEKMPLPA